MKSYLQQLANNEAILLMYLADELPAQDRAEVAQMLASDATLRRDLDALRVLQAESLDGIATMDRILPPPVPEAASVRRVTRMMRQSILERHQPKVAPVESARRSVPWARLVTSGAIAAGLLVGYIVWGVYHPQSPNQGGDVAIKLPSPPKPAPLTVDDKVAVLADTLDLSSVDDATDSDVRIAAITPKAGDMDISLNAAQ